MGHKVHPIGFRIGVIRDWQAKWYAESHYADFLQEDLKLRKAIESRYSDAAISLIEIERQANQITITVHTARPGIVIGRGGQRVGEMRVLLENLIGKKVRLDIQEIQQPELDALLVAKTIAEQIKRRIAYRRAMKQTLMQTIRAGAKGVRISCAGRLGGAEIARRLTMHEGQVPLHTLRADIDYGFTEAHTPMGQIGIKVWIYKGEILPAAKTEEPEEIPAAEARVEEAEEIPAAEPRVEEAEEIPAPEPEAKEVEEKPAAKKRTRKVAAPKAEEKPAAEAEAKEVEEKPAAKKRARKVAAPKAEEIPAPEPEAKEVEEKPAARKRTRKVAAPEAEEKPAPEAEAKEVEEKPAARKRTRKVAAPKAETGTPAEVRDNDATA